MFLDSAASAQEALGSGESRLVPGALSVFSGLCVPPYAKPEMTSVVPQPFLPGESLPILEAPGYLPRLPYWPSPFVVIALKPLWLCDTLHCQVKNAVCLPNPLNWELLQDGDYFTTLLSHWLTSTEPVTQ